MECKSCPDGFSTPYLHSRSLAECKGNQSAVYIFVLKSINHSIPFQQKAAHKWDF